MINAATLRARRQRLGWTQSKLAKELGVTQPFVSSAENGKMIRFAKMLDLALSYLEEQEDEREKP